MSSIFWTWRSDLELVPNDTGGWIVRDPLSEKFVFLGEHELLSAKMLNGRQTVQSWCENIRRAYPDRDVGVETLKLFLQKLISQNLLLATQPGMQAYQQAAKPHTPFMLLPSRLFRVQIPIFDPTKLMNSLQPFTKTLFSRTSVLAYVGLLIIACVIFVARFREFSSSVPAFSELATRDSLLTLLVIFCVIKIYHEFAHALTCHHFGGHCRTIGIMLLVFTPIAYSDVSDSWKLPRMQRVVIAAAGVIAEFILAACCIILWSIASPGFTRGVLTYIIVLSTLQTLLFNANPLLRFDGYFVLSDLVRIPNLYQQASTYISGLTQRIIFGYSPLFLQAINDQTFFLAIYGLFAIAYRAFVGVAIVGFLSGFLMAIGQTNLGALTGIWMLGLFIVWPLARFVKMTGREMIRVGLGRRFFVRLVPVSLAVLAILNWPIDSKTIAPCIFLPQGQPLYVTQPGWLDSHLPYGSAIENGSTVATLSNPGLELNKLKLIGQRNELKIMLRELRNQSASEKSALTATEERLAAIEEQIELDQKDLEQLTIVSAESGTLHQPESLPQQNSAFELTDWNDVPLARNNIGAYFERGTILGYVGHFNRRRVVAYVDEADLRNVLRETDLTVIGLDGPQESYKTRLEDFARVSTAQIHPAIDVAGLNTWDRGNPQQTVMRISATVAADRVPTLYSVGKVKFIGGKTTLWQKFYRYLRSEFSVVFG